MLPHVQASSCAPFVVASIAATSLEPSSAHSAAAYKPSGQQNAADNAPPVTSLSAAQQSTPADKQGGQCSRTDAEAASAYPAAAARRAGMTHADGMAACNGCTCAAEKLIGNAASSQGRVGQPGLAADDSCPAGHPRLPGQYFC